MLIPINKQLEGAAKNILKGAGLGLLRPKFFILDNAKIAKENEANELGGNVGYDYKGELFGHPIWDSVTLVANPYTADDGKQITTTTQLKMAIALCEVGNNRNIVKTSVAGRNGTFKEYMSDGDYTVNIKGSLVSQYSNVPPVTELKALNEIVKYPESLVVYSNFLDYYLIQYLVIEDYTIKQREGSRNTIDFELKCSSDIPFEFNAAT